MSPFESRDTPTFRPAFRPPTARPPLPLYVEPAIEEALLSWLLRLAARLRVPPDVLARQSFGIDDRSGCTRWWCRPHPWLLARISERTGVSVGRLRQMTFEGFEPAFRDDEAGARFAGRRYDAPAPEHRAFRFAVCGRCLEGDAKPYLRTAWLLGWMAACPQHETILIERCKACRAGLRLAPLATATSFSPTTCTRCGANLLDGADVPAHPSVIRMQTALWHAKREGSVELKGLGVLTWKETVALTDVLIGMMYTHVTMAEQDQIFRLYVEEAGHPARDRDGPYETRHGSLRFLAWLIEGWPDGSGSTAGRSLLARWLMVDCNRLCRHLRPRSADPWTRGPYNFEPPIRERLRALAGVA